MNHSFTISKICDYTIGERTIIKSETGDTVKNLFPSKSMKAL